ATFKPLHVGSIYGLPSKIIAFLVCFLGVTFPITGTIMWLNRLKKNKRKKTITKENPVYA
ncbi:MAG TPA: PepSY-associated TM helix domain-containing protein, partial [Segetibacter sp.]|nr:PepSY-associated TM helix domain-containing protein [Segetibacter sp.]